MGNTAHQNVWETEEIPVVLLPQRKVMRMVYKIDIRPSTNAVNTTFNVAGLSRMKKIYCRCGRIIGLDSSQVKLKMKLGKELECTECRNVRISKDIDEMNRHFDGDFIETDDY